MNKRKDKYSSPLYQKFISLKVNPLNNNKFLTWKLTWEPESKDKVIQCKFCKKKIKIPSKKWSLTKNYKKKKWEEFLDSRIRSQGFFNRFKPYTTNLDKTSKFASQGNSYKKKFKNNLLAKATFSFLYGGLSKKYLKTRMTKIYKFSKIKNSKSNCSEFFESRLDSVLYRSQFCTSVRSARQLITHKHIRVNGSIEKNKDCLIKKGDQITVTPKVKKLIKKLREEKFKKCPDFIIWPIPPKYLSINYTTLEILMGNIKNFNFSSSFAFKIETHSIVKNNYRY
jgi:small subunit ribosomal protein S4